MDELKNLRKKINKIDKKLLNLINERKLTVEEIAKLKKNQKIGIVDRKREYEILEKCENQYQKNILKTIIKESIKVQKGL